jgi:RNA polymerase sigma-B factor
MAPTKEIPQAVAPRLGEAELFRRCAAGDQQARARLIERYMGLARSLARRYESSGESMEDLTQVAFLGLVNAVSRFDPDRGLAFSSFAVPTILGEVKRYFRDRTWAVRVPRSLLELSLRIHTATIELERRSGHSPTVAELCDHLDLDEAQVLDALQAGRSHRATSLDAPQSSRNDEATLGERIASDTARDYFRRADDRLVLAPLLATLPPREQRIMSLRFDDDLTQQQIAEQIGISQMQISRIIRKAVDRLHALAAAA